MIRYTTSLLKFDKQGEKTGWTYIVIPADIAQQINPGIKKSFADNFLTVVGWGSLMT